MGYKVCRIDINGINDYDSFESLYLCHDDCYAFGVREEDVETSGIVQIISKDFFKSFTYEIDVDIDDGKYKFTVDHKTEEYDLLEYIHNKVVLTEYYYYCLPYDGMNHTEFEQKHGKESFYYLNLDPITKNQNTRSFTVKGDKIKIKMKMISNVDECDCWCCK